MKSKLAIALAFATVYAGTALGDTIDFRGSNAALGHSQVYNPGPNSVTAYAFGGSNLLYGKNESGSEHGVGISGNHDNEITSSTFIELDLSHITGLFSLEIGSTQSVEGFKVCSSNALGSLGGSCQDFATPGSDPFTTWNFTKGTQFVTIQADGTGDVLLDGLNYSASPVPEPSSLLLLGTGILGVAGAVRRKVTA